MEKSSSAEQSLSESLPKTEDEFELTPTENRTITITLQAYEHIETSLPICDIQTECIYNNEEIGVSPPIPITDNEILPIDYSFNFIVNIASVEELDIFISSPALLKISLSQNAFDPELYAQLMLNPECSPPTTKSVDSVNSIYEAFNEEKTQTVPNIVLSVSRRSTQKSLKKNEGVSDGKNRKSSTKSNMSDSIIFGKSLEQEASYNKTRVLYGVSTIDFIPFFYGESLFKETLLIKQSEEYDDDRMRPFKHYPKVIVSVSIDQPLKTKNSLIMHFSIESIYNFPNFDVKDLDIQVCWVLPKSEDSYSSPIIMNSPIRTNQPIKGHKFWPNLKKDESNCTKYSVNAATDNIKSSCVQDIDTDNFRLEFNVIKRTIFFEEGKYSIEKLFKIYKHILLEIQIVSHKSKRSFTNLQTPSHFMAIVDVTGLLYPGAHRTRVAAPVKSFFLEEAKNICGLEMSFFKGEEINEDQSRTSLAKNHNQEKDRKSRQKSARTQRKNTTSVSLSSEINTKQALVNDSNKSKMELTGVPVYNENKRQCFIVVEIELSKPINKMRDIKDLSNRLTEIIKKETDHKDKIILTGSLATDYYTEVLNEIIVDLNEKFIRFIQENPKYKNKNDSQIQIDFLKFLQKNGAYKLYLNSISRAISLVATTETKFKNLSENNSESTQTFIGELFCFLISKMHYTVNGIICNGLQPSPKNGDISKKLFFYAKEAAEIGETELANRYFLERLIFDEHNSEYWFDYAVFFLELNDIDGALESTKKALALNHNHRYSILLLGIIMVIKLQKEEAETAFLKLMANESKWVEGWGVLYIFYQYDNDIVKMGWALEMAKKNLHTLPVDDTFSKFEDLAWSPRQYPNRIFLRTAILLIKLRVFSWAEIACSQELHANNQLMKTLLAVICYYRKNFLGAVNYLCELKSSKIWNDSLTALLGHCLLGTEKKEDAKYEYYCILKTKHCTTELHLTYMRCAEIMENQGETQEARKLILLACKYSPTPFTWLKAAQLYYLQQDFLSAEECLTVANSLDNRSAEIWGYLTLTNLKLFRFNEAELCFNQAIKRNLRDEYLLKNIEEERIKHNLPK